MFFLEILNSVIQYEKCFIFCFYLISYELDPDDGYSGKVLPYDSYYTTKYQQKSRPYRPQSNKINKYPIQSTKEPSYVKPTTIEPNNKFNYENDKQNVSVDAKNEKFHP